MMKTILYGGVAAVALAAVAPALAQAPAAREQRGTKVQTRADVTAKVERHFARVDANRDGVVTQAEVQALETKRGERLAKRADRAERRDPAQRFARLDANDDGQVTRAEFDARHVARAERRAAAGKPVRARAGERLFTRLDADGNGAITRAEFDARAAARGQRLERRAERMERRGMRGHGGGRFGTRMFAMADANKDARVTLQEATTAALRHFDHADANRDGQVTREERRQMRQQMRARHGQHRG